INCQIHSKKDSDGNKNYIRRYYNNIEELISLLGQLKLK
ncbi:unnamed protein product, partial [marine sediment metagenome]